MGKRRRPTECKPEPTHPLDVRFVPHFHPPSVPLHDPGCHRRPKGRDAVIPVHHALIQNHGFPWTLGFKLSGRETARAEHNVPPPFFPLSGARRRAFICCMDLPFDFSFSTTGKNISVKLHIKEPVSSPLDRNPPQADICHGRWTWYGPQR